MKLLPPVEAPNKWRIAQSVSFVAVVAVFLWGGGKAGMRAMGILMLIGMCVQLGTRAAGALMLAQPEFMLYLFGWDWV